VLVAVVLAALADTTGVFVAARLAPLGDTRAGPRRPTCDDIREETEAKTHSMDNALHQGHTHHYAEALACYKDFEALTQAAHDEAQLGNEQAKALCKQLDHRMRVLEYGTQTASLLFSKYVKRWETITSDFEVHQKLGDVSAEPLPLCTTMMCLEARCLKDTFAQSLVAPDTAPANWTDPKGEGAAYVGWQAYAEWPRDVGHSDLIIIRGQAHVRCAKAVIKLDLLSRGGRLIVFDWDDKKAKQIVGRLPFELADPVVKGSGMAILRHKTAPPPSPTTAPSPP